MPPKRKKSSKGSKKGARKGSRGSKSGKSKGRKKSSKGGKSRKGSAKSGASTRRKGSKSGKKRKGSGKSGKSRKRESGSEPPNEGESKAAQSQGAAPGADDPDLDGNEEKLFDLPKGVNLKAVENPKGFQEFPATAPRPPVDPATAAGTFNVFPERLNKESFMVEGMGAASRMGSRNGAVGNTSPAPESPYVNQPGFTGAFVPHGDQLRNLYSASPTGKTPDYDEYLEPRGSRPRRRSRTPSSRRRSSTRSGSRKTGTPRRRSSTRSSGRKQSRRRSSAKSGKGKGSRRRSGGRKSDGRRGSTPRKGASRRKKGDRRGSERRASRQRSASRKGSRRGSERGKNARRGSRRRGSKRRPGGRRRSARSYDGGGGDAGYDMRGAKYGAKPRMAGGVGYEEQAPIGAAYRYGSINSANPARNSASGFDEAAMAQVRRSYEMGQLGGGGDAPYAGAPGGAAVVAPRPVAPYTPGEELRKKGVSLVDPADTGDTQTTSKWYASPTGEPVEVNTEVRRSTQRYVDENGQEHYEPFEVVQVRKSTRTYIDKNAKEPVEEMELRKSTKKYVNPAGSHLFEVQLRKSTRRSNKPGEARQVSAKPRNESEAPPSGEEDSGKSAKARRPSKDGRRDRKGSASSGGKKTGRKGKKRSKSQGARDGDVGRKGKRAGKGGAKRKGSAKGKSAGKGGKTRSAGGKRGSTGGGGGKKSAGRRRGSTAKSGGSKGGKKNRTESSSTKPKSKEREPSFFSWLFGNNKKKKGKSGSKGRKGSKSAKGKKGGQKTEKSSRPGSKKRSSSKRSAPSESTAATREQSEKRAPAPAEPIIPTPVPTPIVTQSPSSPAYSPSQPVRAPQLNTRSDSAMERATGQVCRWRPPVPDATECPPGMITTSVDNLSGGESLIECPTELEVPDISQQKENCEDAGGQWLPLCPEPDPCAELANRQIGELQHRIMLKLSEIQSVRNEICGLQCELEKNEKVFAEKKACLEELSEKHAKLDNTLEREFAREQQLNGEFETCKEVLDGVMVEYRQDCEFNARDRHMYQLQQRAHEDFHVMQGYGEIHDQLMYDKVNTLKIWHQLAQDYLEETACMTDSQQKAKQGFTAAAAKYKRIKTQRDCLSSEFTNLQEESERELQAATREDQAERQEDQLTVAKYKDHLQRCLINRDLKYETVLEAKDYLVSCVKEQVQQLYNQHIVLDAAGMDAIKTFDDLMEMGYQKKFANETMKLLGALPLEAEYVDHLEKIQKLLAEYVKCMHEIDAKREELLKERAELLGVQGYGIIPDDDPDGFPENLCACACPVE